MGEGRPRPTPPSSARCSTTGTVPKIHCSHTAPLLPLLMETCTHLSMRVHEEFMSSDVAPPSRHLSLGRRGFEASRLLERGR